MDLMASKCVKTGSFNFRLTPTAHQRLCLQGTWSRFVWTLETILKELGPSHFNNLQHRSGSAAKYLDGQRVASLRHGLLTRALKMAVISKVLFELEKQSYSLAKVSVTWLIKIILCMFRRLNLFFFSLISNGEPVTVFYVDLRNMSIALLICIRCSTFLGQRMWNDVLPCQSLISVRIYSHNWLMTHFERSIKKIRLWTPRKVSSDLSSDLYFFNYYKKFQTLHKL